MKKLLNHIYRFYFPEKNAQEVKEKYGIPEKIDFNIGITHKGYFVLTSKDLPGLITQAKNYEELVDNFNDAVLSYYDVPKKESDTVFDQLKIKTSG